MPHTRRSCCAGGSNPSRPCAELRHPAKSHPSDQTNCRDGRQDQTNPGHHLMGDVCKVPKPQGKIDDDMRNRIGERRHADHSSHDDQLAPTEYRQSWCDRQGEQQHRRSPQARPVSHSTERSGSELLAADLIKEPDRRRKRERECARLEPRESALPILPGPDQGQSPLPRRRRSLFSASKETCYATVARRFAPARMFGRYWGEVDIERTPPSCRCEANDPEPT